MLKSCVFSFSLIFLKVISIYQVNRQTKIVGFWHIASLDVIDFLLITSKTFLCLTPRLKVSNWLSQFIYEYYIRKKISFKGKDVFILDSNCYGEKRSRTSLLGQGIWATDRKGKFLSQVHTMHLASGFHFCVFFVVFCCFFLFFFCPWFRPSHISNSLVK